MDEVLSFQRYKWCSIKFALILLTLQLAADIWAGCQVNIAAIQTPQLKLCGFLRLVCYNIEMVKYENPCIFTQGV